jgi:hypothetical protein
VVCAALTPLMCSVSDLACSTVPEHTCTVFTARLLVCRPVLIHPERTACALLGP